MGPRMHSYPIYKDYQKRRQPFAQVACRRQISVSASIDNRTERLDAEMVSGNYFSMLGVKAAAGRVFNSRDDDQIYGGHPVVVLGYDYWMSRFAGDRARHRQEDPGQQLPHDHRRRLGGGLCRPRPGARAADPGAGPDVPRAGARVDLAAHGRSPRPVGPGVRAIEAGLDRRIGAGADAAPLHADPLVRDDAAGGEGLVQVLARPVHEGRAARRERRARLLVHPQRFLDGADRA